MKIEKERKKTSQGSSPSIEQAKGIDKNKAADIALQHAGLSRGDVRKLETEYKEKKDYYEVEFKFERWEYEYKIDAVTGAILSWEKERD